MQAHTTNATHHKPAAVGRLRRRADFAAVFDEGREFTRGPLAVRVRPNPEAVPSRFGFAVGKRLGSAVRRNRIRRRLRALLHELPFQDGADVVVIARGGATEASYADLRASLSWLLARAGVLEADASATGGENGATPCA